MAKEQVSREFRKLISALDIEVLKTRRSKHTVMQLRNRYGVTRIYTVAQSASCPRAFKNLSSDFRSFAAQQVQYDVR